MVLTDITERLEFEAERARLAAIAESSGDAIISRNRENVITSGTGGPELMFGHPAGDIIGRPFDDLTPPEIRAQVDRLLQRAMTGEQLDHLEMTRLAKDGRRILVSASISPVRDAAGNIVGISTIMRDITRQKEAEEALRQSERSLADFFAESPLGLLWVGPRGEILRVNRAQLELIGRSHEEVLGRPVAEFHADPEIAAHLLARLDLGETVQNHRVRLRQKNGTLLHVLIDANGLWDNTTLVHSRWFVRDITRRVNWSAKYWPSRNGNSGGSARTCMTTWASNWRASNFWRRRWRANWRPAPKPGAGAGEGNRPDGAAAPWSPPGELACGLSPISLETDGLMVGLRELAARVKKLFRIDCRFRCKTPVLIHDHDVGIHLYRIAQEAVNNAVKHGKARRIDIGLTVTGERIVLAVSDNGIGLPKKPRNKNGLGLRVMQYRAGVIDASLIAQRLPNGGTTFVCTVKEQRPPPANHEDLQATANRPGPVENIHRG